MVSQRNLFDEDEMFKVFPPNTRYRVTDPETSAEAAHSLEDTRATQKEVYSALRVMGPATDESLIERMRSTGSKQSSSGIRTRRSELVSLGLVRDTGVRRPLASGRRAIVWEVSDDR